ncbi:hypothetical protein E2562_007102 [Oryza meyeriana var. granulata]|uniref:Uncharacterized protein n=1 Tax=Oryza meyeriana var. granulata TaxID=110450 RepID=A0A6G1F4W9_9ORYZ|nr:hypothetical protein E2562_007102 [Oryza meyeriana var. granulata]
MKHTSASITAKPVHCMRTEDMVSSKQALATPRFLLLLAIAALLLAVAGAGTTAEALNTPAWTEQVELGAAAQQLQLAAGGVELHRRRGLAGTIMYGPLLSGPACKPHCSADSGLPYTRGCMAVYQCPQG